VLKLSILYLLLVIATEVPRICFTEKLHQSAKSVSHPNKP